MTAPEALKKAWEAFYALHRQGKVKAAWAVENGVAEAVMKMSFGNSIGFQAGLETCNLVCPLRRCHCGGAHPRSSDLPCAQPIGSTTAGARHRPGGETASMAELLALNEGVLEQVYPTGGTTRGGGAHLLGQAVPRRVQA